MCAHGCHGQDRAEGRADGPGARGVRGDVPDIARLLGELSPESFRARFQGGLPTPSLVATLARADQVPGTVCIVAALPREPQHLVAEARYVPIGGDVAELAVTVLDGYQRSGLGEVMLDALVDRAAGEADRIVPGPSAADPHSAAVIEAHRRMWPGKLPS